MQTGLAEVQMAVNHDEHAIHNHWLNHPTVDHDLNDLLVVHPSRYPRCNMLVASPECPYHSTAAGRKYHLYEKDLFGNTLIDKTAIRSRATMQAVIAFCEVHHPELVIVENVVEVRKWRFYQRWWQDMLKLGYEGHAVYLNAMFAHETISASMTLGDFAPQSRDRWYACFWRKGNKAPDLNINPQAYCWHCETDVRAVQSWKRPERKWGKYGIKGGSYVYRCPTCAEVIEPYHFAAANIIDWSQPATRIGSRKRPLKDKTMNRIAAGLERFWGTWFSVDVAYPDSSPHIRSLAAATYTQTARQTQAIAGAYLPMVVTGQTDLPDTLQDQQPFLVPIIWPNANRKAPPRGVNDVAPTIATAHHASLTLVPTTVSMRNSRGSETRGYTVDGIDRALPAQVGVVQQWVTLAPLQVHLRRAQTASDLGKTTNTVTAGAGHHALALVPLMVPYYTNGQARDAAQPTNTVSTVDRSGLLQALAQSEPPAVDDCYFRMLTTKEMQLCQSFGPDYKVEGTARVKTRLIGNANPPVTMSLLTQRMLETL